MMDEVVSRTGGDYTYVELKMSRAGKGILLVIESVVNGCFTSQVDREELGRYLTKEEDEDDIEGEAIDAATDLQRAAEDWLEERGACGRRDMDFGTAVELALEKEKALALAAE